jgi:hypothetical protein
MYNKPNRSLVSPSSSQGYILQVRTNVPTQQLQQMLTASSMEEDTAVDGRDSKKWEPKTEMLDEEKSEDPKTAKRKQRS